MKIPLRLNRMKILLIITAMIIVCVFAVQLFSAEQIKSLPPAIQPAANQPDYVNYILYGLIIIVGWFLIRLITKVDKNQDILFRKNDDRKAEHDKLRHDFDLLKGKCDERSKC